MTEQRRRLAWLADSKWEAVNDIPWPIGMQATVRRSFSCTARERITAKTNHGSNIR